MRKTIKVFIAGVYQREDSKAIVEESQRLCEKYGFELANDGERYWDILFAIRACDVVIANYNINQGTLSDGETEIEVGMAAMAGKKIYAYYSNTDLCQISNVAIAPVILIEGSFEDCLRAI